MHATATSWEPQTEDWEQVVRNVFAQQGALALIGAELGSVELGMVEVTLPRTPKVTQQYGTVHGGIVGMLADTAAALAALTVAPAGMVGVTAEYKLNLLAPATGELILARGRVIRPGRPLTVAACDVYAVTAGAEQLVATALVTLAGSRGRARVS
ncbi:MAG: PaaI family thioesterase [Solirubrobacteraceae bacterium]